MHNKYRRLFRAEALELLQALENTVQDLAADPEDVQAASSVYRVMRRLRRLLDTIGPHNSKGGTTPPAKPIVPEPAGKITYRIRFAPASELLQKGIRPLAVLRELYEIGECTCIPYVHKIPRLADLDPESCVLYWDVLLTTHCSVDQIREIFQCTDDECHLTIDPVDELSYEEIEPSKPLGEILVERGVVTAAVLNKALQSQRRIGQVLTDGGVDAYEIQAALEEQDHIIRSRKNARQDSERQAIRMIPMESDVGTVRRQVHALTEQLQKPEPFFTAGAETELDKENT